MVAVVTDGSCDMPPELVRRLNVRVVPLYVQLGGRSYLDGVDIGPEQFYHHQSHSLQPPQTSGPSPGDFLRVYQALAQDTREIVSIHLSSGLSATCNAARVASGYMEGKCRIAVIDSGLVSVALGLVVVAAAEAAQRRQSLDQIVRLVQEHVSNTRLFGAVQSFRYLLQRRRFRLTFGLVLLGRVASLFRARFAGEVYDGRRIRSPAVAFGQAWTLDWLRRQPRRFRNVTRMAVGYSTARSEAEKLARLLARQLPEDRLIISRLGSALEAYVGPGTLALAFTQGGCRRAGS